MRFFFCSLLKKLVNKLPISSTLHFGDFFSHKLLFSGETVQNTNILNLKLLYIFSISLYRTRLLLKGNNLLSLKISTTTRPSYACYGFVNPYITVFLSKAMASFTFHIIKHVCIAITTVCFWFFFKFVYVLSS